MIATDNVRRNTCDDDICDNGTGDERQNTCDDATDDERQNTCDDAKSDERQNTCDNATDDERQNHHLQHSHVHFPRQACERNKNSYMATFLPYFFFLNSVVQVHARLCICIPHDIC